MAGEPILLDHGDQWRIRVELYANQDGSLYFSGSLRSKVRPGILTRASAKVEGSSTVDAFAAQMLRAADEQSERHGDNHSHDTLIRMMGEALRRIQVEWQQSKQDIWATVVQSGRFDKPLITATIPD